MLLQQQLLMAKAQGGGIMLAMQTTNQLVGLSLLILLSLMGMHLGSKYQVNGGQYPPNDGGAGYVQHLYDSPTIMQTAHFCENDPDGTWGGGMLNWSNSMPHGGQIAHSRVNTCGNDDDDAAMASYE